MKLLLSFVFHTLLLGVAPVEQDSDEHSSLRGLQQSSCGVRSFSVYNPKNQKTSILNNSGGYGSRIFLEEYTDGKLNFVANVAQPCAGAGGKPIKCVLLSFADVTRRDTTTPYTLYATPATKPEKTGWQTLQAWAYTDTNCTKGRNGYRKQIVHILPNANVTAQLINLKAAYTSTKGPTNPVDLRQAISETCKYVNAGLKDKHDLNIQNTTMYLTASLCTGQGFDLNGVPLQLNYNVTARYTAADFVGPNDYGKNMPTPAQIQSYVKRMFTNQVANGPPPALKIVPHLKTKLPATSAYYAVTGIVLK